MVIISKQNAKIKEIKSLEQKKYRRLLNKYIVEGVKMVKEAILNGEDIDLIIVKEGKDFGVFDAQVLTVSEEVFSYLSYEENPQGIMAVLNIGKKQEFGGNALLLDGISDPGNLGTIIRTAAASGYNDIYLKNCTDPYSQKAVRASMSGIFYVNLIIGGAELLDSILLPIITADMGGVNVFQFTPPKKFCLAIGSEADGLSSEVKSKSAYTVGLPMQKVESLNAGVAAGVIMYELSNRK